MICCYSLSSAGNFIESNIFTLKRSANLYVRICLLKRKFVNTVLNLFHVSSISFAARRLVFPKKNGIAKKKVFFSDSKQRSF